MNIGKEDEEVIEIPMAPPKPRREAEPAPAPAPVPVKEPART